MTEAKEVFDREIRGLHALVLSTDPVLLLSALSAYQFHSPGINPEYKFTDPLLQFHLEWLQGFCLRFDITEYARPPFLNPVLKETTERLKRIPILSALERWQRAERTSGGVNPVISTWEQELARIERLAVRNWGYADQMISLVCELCERVDAWAEEAFGYPLSPLPPLLMSIVVETERRYNAHRRQTQSMIQHTRSPIGFCRRWQSSKLLGNDRAGELETGLRAGTLEIQDVLQGFIRASETAFPTFFNFSSEEIAGLSGGAYDPRQCKQILDSLNLTFGSLKTFPIDYLTLGNPAWQKPFIKLGDDSYLIPIPGMLLSHCIDIVESFVVPRDAKRWWDARSVFLERHASEILSEAFPSAAERLESKWIDPNDNATVYENDIALFLGDAVLVAEAKSHRVPAEVRRGAPKGMRESIEEMVVYPSTQSRRFCQYLFAERGERPFFNNNDAFSIDSSPLRSAIRITIVLDSFAIASISTTSLRVAGLLHEDELNPAPTLLLSDLESILLLLPDELQRLHYLSRRAILQDRLDYQANEIDLLALYVDSGFAWEGLEATGEKLLIHGVSSSIDPYLEKYYAGKRGDSPPRRPLHRLWSNILRRLERETPSDWVSIGLLLLDASAEQQTRFFDAATNQCARLKRSDGDVLIDGWAAEIGNTLVRSLVIGIVTKGQDEDVLKALIETRIHELHSKPSLDAAILIFDASVGLKRPTRMRFASLQNWRYL